MVATDTMMSGCAGRMSSASSRPAVSANPTPRSTVMRSAITSSSESGTSGSCSTWLPTVVV